MKKVRRHPSIWLILIVAMLHGTLYVFLIPPWQHYDEPSHFEYVWLLANGESPRSGNPDLGFRRKLVQSMMVNNFFPDGFVPSLDNVEAGIRTYGLEYSQLDEPPLFYLLSFPVVQVLRTQNPAVMLIAARMVSVGLLGLTIWAVWGIVREITYPDHFLQIWGPLSLALLPGFVELMSAVNNDVGAITAFTFFLWGCIYFLNRPHSLVAVGWVIITSIICVGMKSTAYLAAPLGIFALLLGWMKGRAGKWIGAVLMVLGVIGIFAIFTWDEPAYWHRGSSQLVSTRVKTEKAPVGDFALQIDYSAPTTPHFIAPVQQPLDYPKDHQILTLGVWMWADEIEEVPIEIKTPVLSTEAQEYFDLVTIHTTPQFYSFEISLPSGINRLWLSLAQERQKNNIHVSYDGFILVEGRFPPDSMPIFDDSEGIYGFWNGIPFQNMIRNPSLETVWPAIVPVVDNQLSVLLPNNVRISTLLYGVLDWSMTEPYFRATARNLLETFWGRFGWGHVPLMFPLAYEALSFLTVAGGIGFLIFFIRRKLFKNKKVILFGLATGVLWGATMLRGEIFLFETDLFIPGARYAYPVIAPTFLGLMLGWREWGRTLRTFSPARTVDLQKLAHIMLALFFLILNVVSIYSVFVFYKRI